MPYNSGMHCNELLAWVYAGPHHGKLPYNFRYLAYCWVCGHVELSIDEIPKQYG